jgi:hypothetical protein
MIFVKSMVEERLCSFTAISKLGLVSNQVMHNRSEMVAVLGPLEALPYYIHTYIHIHPPRFLCSGYQGQSAYFKVKNA